DPPLAFFLAQQPPPLGHVKSMALNPRPDPGMLREMSSSMEGLEDATDRLQGASEWAVEAHFLVTARALMRCLCFGKGETDYSWGDPNEHHRLRCTAFISLLHVLHKCSSYFTKVDVSTKHPQPSQALLLAWVEHLMDEEVPVEKGAHDPEEQAREKARELEDLRRREEEAVERLANEALQHVMAAVADELIDRFTYEAIKEKMAEERNSGRASGTGELGADLWVESMVSKGLKWVQSWRAEGQTGSGEQGQAMSPRGRKAGPRRSSIFGSPFNDGQETEQRSDPETTTAAGGSSSTRVAGVGCRAGKNGHRRSRSSFDANFGTPIVGRGRSGGGGEPAAGGAGALPTEQGRGSPSPGKVLTSAFKSAFTSSSSSSANPSGGVSPSPPPPPVGTFSGARVGSMRLGGGSIAGFAAQPGSAKQQQQQQQPSGGLGSRPQSLRTAPPSPLPPHQPG
ncbi:unnamed protein product, partial [Ectocarpus fasciculatus]